MAKECKSYSGWISGVVTLQDTFSIAGEPDKLGRQKYISLDSSFHKLFKNETFRQLRGNGKTLS